MNILEIITAFAEGLALIASPCILPVLPLVLGASVEGGRKRPFGIITGFVFSFALFALLSRAIVATFHIDLDILKNISLILLFLFGCILISEKLSKKFSELTQGLAETGTRISSSGKEGFTSGLMVGSLIGLVWTPCAGPIMAAVLVQVIRQQTDISGVAIIFSFALGAGLPMLIIALMGRKIMSKLSFFTRQAETTRKIFGAMIIASVIFIASGFDATSILESGKTQIAMSENKLQNALEAPYPAPAIEGTTQWINSQPLSINNLKGKVVLIDFWTYSCINCVRTLPYLTAWDKKYRDKGLVIIGIHAPEFEFEKNPQSVATALTKYGIKYPVALDNHLTTWTNFHNQYWPAHYLIDKNGNVVYTHSGEGHYDITENNIRYLLGLNKKVAGNDTSAVSANQTPETYLGYARADRFSENASSLENDHWTIMGKWKSEAEKITAQKKGATLQINFYARKVFLVMGNPTGNPIHAAITLNGKPAGAITIVQNTLYELISQDTAKRGILEIKSDAAGLEAYAFTFGS